MFPLPRKVEVLCCSLFLSERGPFVDWPQTHACCNFSAFFPAEKKPKRNKRQQHHLGTLQQSPLFAKVVYQVGVSAAAVKVTWRRKTENTKKSYSVCCHVREKMFFGADVICRIHIFLFSSLSSLSPLRTKSIIIIIVWVSASVVIQTRMRCCFQCPKVPPDPLFDKFIVIRAAVVFTYFAQMELADSHLWWLFLSSALVHLFNGRPNILSLTS